MTPDSVFSDIIGVDPVKGVFFLPSGKTAVTRIWQEDGMIFESGEGAPKAAMIVAIDMGGEREVIDADGKKANRSFPPSIVGGILTVNCRQHFESLGNKLFRIGMKGLFAKEAVLYEALSCSVCGAHPAPFGVGGERRCGGHNGAQSEGTQATGQAQGSTPSQGVPGV